jgi:hypothetical protein
MNTDYQTSMPVLMAAALGMPRAREKSIFVPLSVLRVAILNRIAAPLWPSKGGALPLPRPTLATAVHGRCYPYRAAMLTHREAVDRAQVISGATTRSEADAAP